MAPNAPGQSVSLIEPIYITGRANDAIILGSSCITIAAKGMEIRCRGEAALRLRPRPRLVVVAEVPEASAVQSLGQFGGRPVTLKFGDYSPPTKSLVLCYRYLPDGSVRVELSPNPQELAIYTSRRARLNSVIFHVMNFPKFLSGNDVKWRSEQGDERLLGRVVLNEKDWIVEIQELPRTKELVEELRKEGGYGITHVGRLTRRKHSFSISEAEKILRELHVFLSFARGLSTPLVLPVGLDAGGHRAYENWGLGLGTPWEPRGSWFDLHHGECLAGLYPGFMALLRDGDLGKAASSAIYWYLRSNRAGEGAGVDSGIILAQAALERLTSAYLARRGLPQKGNAAVRFVRAWQALGLPTAIPKATSLVYRARTKNGPIQVMHSRR